MKNSWKQSKRKVVGSMDDFIAITKALSDPNRVRALMALRDGELCVCQIIELLGLAPSTVSKHMSILKQAGLVENRKEERWMYYRLLNKKAQTLMIQGSLEWFFKVLEDDVTGCSDYYNLKKILKQNPSNLCKMQRSK
jgi:ArsR family transcriptional regulator, arsenate/arsenite/antimonite-responsive transcriptional repressor